MPHPVIHWELNTAEAGPAVQFYKDLFGWTVQNFPEMDYNMVLTESGRGADGAIQARNDAPRGVTLYVEVDDPQAYLDKAVQLGAQVAMPVTTIPGMVTFGLFVDPQGNVMGVVKNEAPTQ